MHFFFRYLFFLGYFFFSFLCAFASPDTVAIIGIQLKAKELLDKDPQQAMLLAKKSLEQSQQMEHDSLEARANYLLGLAYYYRSQFELSSAHYQKALNSVLAEQDIKFRSACWNNLGINFDNRARYSDALNAYLKSLRMAEQMQDSVEIGQSWINVGLLYAKLKREKEARKYEQMATDLFRRRGDRKNLALCYQNFSYIFETGGQLRKAVLYQDSALAVYKEIGDQKNYLFALSNQADLYADVKDVRQSRRYIIEAERVNKQFGDSLVINFLRATEGKNAGTMGEYAQAEGLLLEARDGLEGLDAKEQVMEVQTNLMDLYVQAGRYADYLKLRIRNFAWFEEEYLQKESARMAELKVLYDQETRDLKIEKQAYDLRMKTRENWILYTCSAILFMSVGALAFLYMRLKSANIALLIKNRDEMGLMRRYDALAIVGDTVEETKGDPEGDMRFKEMYRKIVAFLSDETQYRNPNFSIADLTRLLNTNERYVSRTINDYSGMNFNRLLNSFRVNAAKKMLIDPQYQYLSNDQLADKVGFGNVNTFYRQFKEFTGFTPMKFKKLNKEVG